MEFNLAQANEIIASAVPDRECIVHGSVRRTYAEVAERSRRFANGLLHLGLGGQGRRPTTPDHESDQDHVALYLHNGAEYLEAMLGSYKARCAPLNVNYRYVADELRHVLTDGRARAVVYDRDLAPSLAEVLPSLGRPPHLIELGEGEPRLPGAVGYESLLAAASAELPPIAGTWSPDDLYIVYTGGTTGYPKGVLWRQGDVFVSALRGVGARGREHESDEELAEWVRGHRVHRMLPAPPFMHAAGHWVAYWAFHSGSTVVIQDEVRRFDPHDVLATIDREKVGFLLIVGDAFGWPLVDAIRGSRHDLSSLRIIQSGGAVLSPTVKAALLELLPHVRMVDGVGASETGAQGSQVRRAGDQPSALFQADADTAVLDETKRRVLSPGHDGAGWLGKRGRIPLGYLGDAEKTAQTFPQIDGVRWSIPGDRAIHRTDGWIELLGRESATINSGGEKIFAEEVEVALREHPAVGDVLVVGRPSSRWGSEVVAVVAPAAGTSWDSATEAEVLAAAGRRVARFKLPKAVIVVDEIRRSPAGKPDYAWARAQVAPAPPG